MKHIYTSSGNYIVDYYRAHHGDQEASIRLRESGQTNRSTEDAEIDNAIKGLEFHHG